MTSDKHDTPDDLKYPNNFYVDVFVDFFIAMLRAARSQHDATYRQEAAALLGSWLDIASERPKESLRDVIDVAVERIGFQHDPKSKVDAALVRIANAGITYLIEAGAAGKLGSGLLSRRTDEFSREIEGYSEWRQERPNQSESSRE